MGGSRKKKEEKVITYSSVDEAKKYSGKALSREQYLALPNDVRKYIYVNPQGVAKYDSTPESSGGVPHLYMSSGGTAANPQALPVPAAIPEQRATFDNTMEKIQAEQMQYQQNYQQQLAAQQQAYNEQLAQLQNQFGTQTTQQQQALAAYQQQLAQLQQDRDTQGGLLSQQLNETKNQLGAAQHNYQTQLEAYQNNYQQQLAAYQQQLAAQRQESEGLLSGLQNRFTTQLQERDQLTSQLQQQYAAQRQEMDAQRLNFTNMINTQAEQARLAQEQSNKALMQMESRNATNTTQVANNMAAKNAAQGYQKYVQSLKGTAQLPQELLRGSSVGSLLRR